ncbi:MAG TPA: RimK family alpha-L-glutamate ligase [Pseudogracilibacillus sp.]|nr:RimK family alpha-L-glutamate ligase [Pseudogracilibacillus sp.]
MTYSSWIIYNAYLQGNKFKDYAQMLARAAEEKGHRVTVLKNNELTSMLSNHLSFIKREEMPDYVLFTDKDLYLATQLELMNIPIFNRAKTIAITDDKIKTYQRLAYHRLPIPKTVVAPKTFGYPLHVDDPFIEHVVRTFPYPFVMKEAYGSFGEQVYLIENEKQLAYTLQKIVGKPFLVQTFIEESFGRDVRIQVVGEKVVAAMIRSSKDDFRANVTSGGVMEPYRPTERECDIAIRASKAVGAHFSGVDLLFGPNDEPIICEVNSNAHIRNLLDCTGIDASYPIIGEVERQLKGVTQ